MIPVNDWKAPERNKRSRGSHAQDDENAIVEDEKRQKVEEESLGSNHENV